MSVVQRQGFKYTIIGYFGFLLGTLSAIFIFPFNLEFYGKLRYVLSMAELFLPIVVFGLSFSNVKFFIPAQKQGKHQNMLSLSLAGVIINFAIFVGGYLLASYIFPGIKESRMWEMKLLILPLILVLAISAIFNKYLSNFKRIVVPNIFENIIPKLANLGAFSLFMFLGFSDKTSYWFFLLMFVFAMIGYWIYTNRLEQIQFDFSTTYFKENNFWKTFISYSFFGFLGNIGNLIAVRIDNVMIGEYIGFEDTGIYSTMLSIISLITVPAMGLYSISAPVINQHFQEDTMEELDKLHKTTSLSLFFLGLVLFSCIVVGFPYLVDFIKNGELLKHGEPVIWILGMAFLFDLATGFNGHIISLSKYYKFNIIVMLLLAGLTVFLNFLFLNNTDLGIIGIAMATAISLTLFNLTKIIFNYWKFNVFPLTIEMLYAVIVASIAISVLIIIPEFESSLLNLFFKPFMVLVVFLVGNHFLKIYPIEKYINKNFLKSLFKF